MHALITGASSGIGEALAREMLARGWDVTMVARRRDLLDTIAKSATTSRAHVITADLADPSTGHAFLDEAEDELGAIDVLVNNAGVQIVKHMHETAWEDGERLLKLDLLVPMRLTHEMVKRMIPRQSGCIVDISSMAAIAPTPGMFFYNAAKAGLAAASEGLRAEVKPHGIHVVTVYPGPVSSAMEAAARANYEDRASARYTPTGSPDALARLIALAILKKRPRVVYPALYGFARHFPNATRWAVDSLTPPLKSS